MTLTEVVDHIVDEWYPWAKPHGQNSWDKSSEPSDTSAQPAPVDAQGQPLPSLDAPPAPVVNPPPPTSGGNFDSFDLKVSNRRELPTELSKFPIMLEVSVNTNKVEHWCAINFQEASGFDDYVIHFHFNNYDEPIHFTQKYEKHWTQNASATAFTLKEASYDQGGTRKLRVVVAWAAEEQTYVFSFLSEEGHWLTHKYAPGYKINYLYYNGWRTGEAPLYNDLRVTPLPLFSVDAQK